MAVSPLKTWAAGEILTASDLNAEFLNILNNGQTIGFPRTTSADFDAQTLILDADGDTSMRANTDDQIDFQLGGTDRIRFTTTQILINGAAVLTSASNEFRRLQSLAGEVALLRHRIHDPGPYYAQVLRG